MVTAWNRIRVRNVHLPILIFIRSAHERIDSESLEYIVHITSASALSISFFQFANMETPISILLLILRPSKQIWIVYQSIKQEWYIFLLGNNTHFPGYFFVICWHLLSKWIKTLASENFFQLIINTLVNLLYLPLLY